MSEQVTNDIHVGVVKWFNEKKGYGFIEDRTANNDLFVHITSVAGGQIAQADTVNFTVEQGRKGPQAANVTIVEHGKAGE